MNAELIRKVENETQQHRREALLRARLRTEKALADYPELAALEKERRRQICSGHPAHEEIERLEAQEAAFLQARGIAPETLQPVFTCPVCRDTGYVQENGLSVRCRCVRQRLLELLFSSDAGLSREQTFEQFDLSVFSAVPGEGGLSPRENMEKIRAYCEKYADSYPHVRRPNVLFSGATGVGKTYLMNCMGIRLMQQGNTVLYLTAGHLFDILRRYALSQSDSIDELYETDILLVDDLGTEPLFNHITVEYLFMLFNERIRRKKALLISTNLSPAEITARYTERVSSRLFDTGTSVSLRITGSDLRLQ